MRCDAFLERLQNLTGVEIGINSLESISGTAKKTWYARMSRNANVPDEEIELFERKYAIDLLGSGNSKDTLTLNYYPNVFGSCGTGLMVFDECAEKMTITKDSIEGYSASKQYSIINARGSSMSPRIEDNDKLVIQHCIDEQIIDDNVYLFRYNNELFIKRLVKNVDQIVCISENPRFQDRVIEPKEDNFAIVGKVVGLFRSKV